jgi:hypothetical protein
MDEYDKEVQVGKKPPETIKKPKGYFSQLAPQVIQLTGLLKHILPIGGCVSGYDPGPARKTNEYTKPKYRFEKIKKRRKIAYRSRRVNRLRAA